MIGSFLSAWVLFPLVLLAASVGCGLLVRRIAGGTPSRLLVAPTGFALVVVICAFACSYEKSAPAAGVIVSVVAIVGFALEARTKHLHLPRPRFGPWVWPVVAALVAFTAVGGPVFLTGSVSWTGYTRIVDLAFQFDFAQHLAEAGRASPAKGDSSYNIVVAKLIGIGYPGGAQATLGAMAMLIRTNIAWCYQAFLAFATAMGALAIFSILGRVTRNGFMRCIGAAVAIQPTVLYAYGLAAGIKELTTSALLMVVVALLVERLPGDGPRRSVVPAAVAISATFATFSLGIAPWLGLLLVGALVVSLARSPGSRRLVLEGWAVLTVVTIAISLPTIITAAKLASVAGAAVGGVVDLGLGNLAAPVSKWASAGVWLTGDYRFPLTHTTPSHVLDLIVIALAIVGVLAAVLRRRWMIVVVGVMTPIALYYFVEHSTAWIQFKAFTVTGVFAVLLAFAGAAALQASSSRWWSALGWVAALVVTGGVLYGNALVFHDTTLAPGARYHDLASIAKRYAGQGPALDPYFDEYAEFFLRSEKATSIVDPANFTFQVRPGVAPGGMSFGWDLNQLVPGYLESFPLIIQPSSPTTSRAPSNYDLIEQTRYFDIWRQTRSSNTIIEHAPLSNLPHERTPQMCHHLAVIARRGGPNAKVAYTKTSVAAVANPATGTHPSYWKALGPSSLAAYGAGTVRMTVDIPSTGRYSIWLQGSVGRPLTLYIDGKRWASIGYEERYPNLFLPVTTGTLRAGKHTLRLVRGGGSLHPGSGDATVETGGRTIGAVVFAHDPSTANRVYVAPASQAERICNAPVGYSWLELLNAGGAPPGALPADG